MHAGHSAGECTSWWVWIELHIRGAHVLLAEDNKINQQVATELNAKLTHGTLQHLVRALKNRIEEFEFKEALEFIEKINDQLEDENETE